MAILTDISMYRGEDRVFTFLTVPTIDITDWTIEFTVARKKEIPDKLIQLACEITDAPNGGFRVTIPDTATDDIPSGSYQWDVWRIDEGENRILGYGEFLLDPDVREPEA